MDLNMASVYEGNPSEEQVKLAEAQLFAKIAHENGIDLNQLNDDQLSDLWSEFQKTAEEIAAEDEKKDDEEKKEEAKEEEKKEAAAREHAVKLAHAEEERRAADLGKIMAHAYVAEIDKVAAERRGGAEGGEDKEASAMGKLMAARDAVRGAAGKAKDLAGKGMAAAKANPGKAAGGAAAAGAGAGFMAGRASKKEASAGLSPVDELALNHAVKLAADHGLDPEVAAARVGAVAILGLGESEKLASTIDEQINIRALEYLEAAGYQVNWPQS